MPCVCHGLLPCDRAPDNSKIDAPQAAHGKPAVETPVQKLALLLSSPAWPSHDTPIVSLTTAETQEAEQRCLAILANHGYSMRSKREHLWEITALAGGTHFIYSLEQLQYMAQTIEQAHTSQER